MLLGKNQANIQLFLLFVSLLISGYFVIKDLRNSPQVSDVVLVLTTFPNNKNTEIILKELVHRNLVACANVIKGSELESIYKWEGLIETQKEIFVLMKTGRQNLERLTEAIKASHEYKVPEILYIPVMGGNEEYLQWVIENTKGSEKQKNSINLDF